MAMGITLSLLGAQLLDQAGHGAAPMGDDVLFLGGEVGGGAAPFRQPKVGIVAKAASAFRSVDDLAVPLALGDDRLGVVGMADEDQDAAVMGAAGGLTRQVGNEFVIIAPVRLGLAGVAG